MTDWIKCSEQKPEIGEEILFFYNDSYHVGYLISDDGSDKPRKWCWFSYITDHETIEGFVKYWMPLPKTPED